MSTLTLLDSHGTLDSAELHSAPGFAKPRHGLKSRVAYAAAHVAPRVTGDNTPGRPADIDWDATLAFRRHIYSWGLGGAGAMVTAQRKMGLDAASTRELTARI